jgi:hypothetical protein
MFGENYPKSTKKNPCIYEAQKTVLYHQPIAIHQLLEPEDFFLGNLCSAEILCAGRNKLKLHKLIFKHCKNKNIGTKK